MTLAKVKDPRGVGRDQRAAHGGASSVIPSVPGTTWDEEVGYEEHPVLAGAPKKMEMSLMANEGQKQSWSPVGSPRAPW